MAFLISEDIGFGYLVDDVYIRITDVNYNYSREKWVVHVSHYLSQESREAEQIIEAAIALKADIVAYEALTPIEKQEVDFNCLQTVKIPKKSKHSGNLNITTIENSALLTEAYIWLKTLPEYTGAVDC